MTGLPSGVPFARMPGFPRLFSTYCTDYDRLAPFFGGDWRRTDAYAKVAGLLEPGAPARRRVADILERQNAARGSLAQANVEALRAPGALAVVTGQQVGIFAGPLYTLYKALSAVKLARRLSSELGRKVAPVFWLEGGDHDLEEVTGLTVAKGATAAPVRYVGHALPERGNLGSVGALRFTADINRVREDLRAALPASEFRDPVLDKYFSSYQEGVSFKDAFARSMAVLMEGSGLLLFDPEDPAMKQLSAPLFRREILEHAATRARLEATSATLQAHYHVQVRPRATNLFYSDEAGRQAVRPEERGFTWRGAAGSMTQRDLLARLEAEPHRFSPNVVLRPILQDFLLPTVAYVAGPGEVSYFAQFKTIYEWAHLPMPIIFPRASISILEPNVRRILDRHGLDITLMQDDVEALLRQVALAGGEVETAFAAAAPELEHVIQQLRPAINRVDPTLESSADATRALMLKALGKLQSRVVRAEKRKHDHMRGQLQRSRESLYPGGRLQERVVPVVYFLSKYGPGFLKRVQEGLSLDTAQHQVLSL